MKRLLDWLKYSSLYELINPITERYELYHWMVGGITSRTPHLVKQQIVCKYAARYNLKIFVESGTYLGVMVNAVKNVFDDIYTIELDKKLFERAKRKFGKFNHINVLLGNSEVVLPIILKKLEGNCLFWLDAHYSEGITAKGGTITPILEELNQIMKHLKKYVILIDDADSFNGSKGYPSLKEIKKIMLTNSKSHSMSVENKVIIIK